MRKTLYRALVPILLLSLACAGSPLKNAYNASAASIAAYKTAAPLRAELCRPPTPVLSQTICDSTLKVLEVQFETNKTFNELVAKYAETKDQAVLDQIEVLLPVVLAGVKQIKAVIGELQAAEKGVTP